MANSDLERRTRQFEIDRITAQYVAEVKSGHEPRLEDYIARYPDYAAELATFIVGYHLLLADLPEPDDTPDPELSPSSMKALEAIRAMPAQIQPIESLIEQGLARDLPPEALAEQVGISPSILAQLNAKVIAAASIPGELFRRLAGVLDVSTEAVMSYLGAGSQSGPAFFYADTAPVEQQDSFLDVVEASDDLSAERKEEWRRLTR